MKQSELDAIKARCEAATEGPWEDYPNTVPSDYAKGNDVRAVCEPDDRICLDLSPVNAEFIANAPIDIPRLVAEVEKRGKDIDNIFSILESVGLDERIREELAALKKDEKTS